MDEIKRLQIQLEAETAARIAAEDALVLKKQELESAKSDFLENMSHEIRTPLTAIIGFAENLQDNTLNQDETDSALKTICRNAQHLLSVIDDILEVSKTNSENNNDEYHNVYIIELLNDIEQEFFSQARAKGLDFSIQYALPIPINIVSIQKKLMKVLVDVVSNAIKFTDDGSVVIKVQYASSLKKLIISVVDSGVGILNEKKENIFQAFSQQDTSASRKYGGAGLGLYVAKQLIESINGELELTESTKQGSCFEIRLAVGEADVSSWIEGEKELSVFQCSLNDAESVPQLKGKVLLAEDSLDNQKLIEMYVKLTGADIDIVENGQQAVEKAMAGDYDLIIMDIQMPVMDGMAATEMLRMTGYSRPIVALSANIIKGDADKYFTTGFNHYLPKPINKIHFFKALAGYLDQEEIGSRSEQAHSIQDSSAYKRLVENFVSGLPELVTTLQAVSNKQDWPELARMIHSLKGSGGTFGYQEITDYCVKVEAQLEVDNYQSVTGLLNELEVYCTKITQVG